jgi:hypothetical protein
VTHLAPAARHRPGRFRSGSARPTPGPQRPAPGGATAPGTTTSRNWQCCPLLLPQRAPPPAAPEWRRSIAAARHRRAAPRSCPIPDLLPTRRRHRPGPPERPAPGPTTLLRRLPPPRLRGTGAFQRHAGGFPAPRRCPTPAPGTAPITPCAAKTSRRVRARRSRGAPPQAQTPLPVPLPGARCVHLSLVACS